MKNLAVTAVFLMLACAAAADELRLKDGTKVIGTVIGFEDGAFKVETTYGFALVKKEKVATIIFSDAKPEPKKSAAEKKPEPPQASAPPVIPSPAPPTQSSAPPAASNPPPQRPPAKAAAEPMRESVEGNAYINHTFGFRMYKPPSWNVIEGARKLLPSAIVAMGTEDETTLLIIGRGTLRGSLESHISANEKQLREIYENYRAMGESRSTVAGLPAVERKFRGTVDDHDWSGVVISFGRGSEVFTILGMTYADSDLIQIQENVIAKAVASLQFIQ